MKRTLLVALVLAIVSMACSKDSKKNDEPHTAFTTNNWQLVATLNDIGNGSGAWQEYTGPYLFLAFKRDGRLLADNGLLPGDYNNYIVESDSTILLINSLTGNNAKFTYSLIGDKLILWGPCIEACGKKFSRVYPID